MANIILILAVGISVFFAPQSDGTQTILIGTVMNTVAMASNGWKMPVFAYDVTNDNIGEFDPLGLHVVGEKDTKFKLLCDWLNFGVIIMSPGDVMMLMGAILNFGNKNLIIDKNQIGFSFNF